MLVSMTYADFLRPGEKRRALLYDIALIVGGSLLIGLCARLAVVLPFSPVPVTGQTFAVLVIGVLLGSWRGSLCVLAYIMEGAAGLGVFAMGRSGLGVLFGPTGGYLIGFIFAAYVTGFLAERGWDRRVWTTILAMLLGNVTLYAFGLGVLFCLMGFNKATLTVGLYPFIVGDILKVLIAAVILPSGWRLLEATGLPTKGSEQRKLDKKS